MFETLIDKISKPIDLSIFFVTYSGAYIFDAFVFKSEPKSEVFAGIFAILILGLKQFYTFLDFKYFTKLKFDKAKACVTNEVALKKIDTIRILLDNDLIGAEDANQRLYKIVVDYDIDIIDPNIKNEEKPNENISEKMPSEKKSSPESENQRKISKVKIIAKTIQSQEALDALIKIGSRHKPWKIATKQVKKT